MAPLRRLAVLLGTLWASVASNVYALPEPSQGSGQSIQSQLGPKLSPQARIFLATDANFANETTQRWTVFDAPTYFASVKPYTREDVKTTMLYAISKNIPFMATGGGHGYSITFGAIQNGIEIDLGNFKDVKVDSKAQTMTIGGAVTFAEVLDPLYNAGFEVQTGSCACVGMVGATLGAGVGRYQGLHGLILDSLLSVDLLIADGQILTVSKSQHPDLFWGLRGAGFNYGIILSATYQVSPLTNGGNVMNADFVFPLNASMKHWEISHSLQTSLPAELALFTMVADFPQFGGPALLLNAVYIGPKDKGMAAIQPFLDNNPMVANITMLPWNQLVLQAGFDLNSAFCEKGGRHNMYSLGIQNFDPPTFQAVVDDYLNLWKQYPDTAPSTFEIEFFPVQAVQAVSDAATAYPHRNIRAQIMLSFEYTDPSLDTVVNNFATTQRSKLQKTSGFSELEVYVSYAHGDEPLEARYGAEKLPRLRALKALYDPFNYFKADNPLFG